MSAESLKADIEYLIEIAGDPEEITDLERLYELRYNTGQMGEP